MEGQDILDINEKMIEKLIPPIGKQLLFLREQAILKNSTGPSELNNKPETGKQLHPPDDSLESTADTSVSSISGEQSSSSSSFKTGTLVFDDDEVSVPHHPVLDDENPGDLWNDLQNYK